MSPTRCTRSVTGTLAQHGHGGSGGIPMKLGFALPQIGGLRDPEVLASAVRRGEELGYASAWVNDRLLWPTAPRAPYPASADGSLPMAWQRNLDALDVLSFAAALST